MYIAEIEIQNFRNFPSAKQTKIEFAEGTNIIIGHNNAGKTNLIKALQLVFNVRRAKDKLTIDDFNKDYLDFSKPPEIKITVILKEQENDPSDDKVVVYDWITKPTNKYEAKLTFCFFLPQGDDYVEYCDGIKEFKNEDNKYDANKSWRFIKKYYLQKYVAHVYGGNPENKEKADNEMLEKFDFQFLDAIRDAEKQMFFGNNTILKEVLNYFLDFDITNGKKAKELAKEAKTEIKNRENKFSLDSDSIFTELKKRISKKDILDYAKKTGANRGGEPDFDAHVSEDDLLFALRLIVKIGEIDIPISNNGLGYNNLLYISLVLAKMQIESNSSYYGENAKVFPILAIEEPEAHLHPSMQFKLLKFLNDNVNQEGKVRQLFVSTHSTHITSAAELDSIICLYKDIHGQQQIGYPGKAFQDNSDDIDSKNYVKRFLDATKSNMLFADKLIFVEGLAEQLLIPCFAAYDVYDKANNITCEDEMTIQHVSIISVDSRTFKHFLKMYAYNETNNPFAINKKIVCITDADPEKQGNDNKWRGCFPFELKKNEKFHSLATHVTALKNDFENKHKNIFIFHPEEGKGKTLEYELIRYNPTNEILLTDCFPKQNSPHTIESFKILFNSYNKDAKNIKSIIEEYERLLTTEKSKDNFTILKEAINECDFDDMDKSKSIISAIYYKTIESLKGEHALFLVDNFRKDLENDRGFIVPDYIKNAIRKVLE